jgi:hypothetical protein
MWHLEVFVLPCCVEDNNSHICKVDSLCPKFPKTNEELGEAMKGFASKSTDGIIDNCVGVVDGYLLRIKVPSKVEVKNVKSFFSGHYQCYGVNVQAAGSSRSPLSICVYGCIGTRCDGRQRSDW